MRAAATLSLVIAASTAAFADAPAKKPPPPACRPVGAPVLGITRKTNVVVTARTTYYANGAWSYTEPPGPKDKSDAPRRSDAGCVDARTRDAIAKDLAAISWTVEVHRIHCRAYSPDTVEFSVGAAVKYEQRLCGDTLDAASMPHLTAVVAALDNITGARPRHGGPDDE